MKHNTKSAISVCLLAAALLSAAMVSCGGASDTGVVTEAADNSNDTTVVTEVAEETRAQHTVPVGELDFGGEELNMSYFKWQGYEFYFFATEENGDVMNDAIYRRACFVEDALNVKVVSDMYDLNCADFANKMKQIILAGEDAYDLVFNHCIDGISTFASGGYLYNLDTLPYIDMTAEWWNKKQMDYLRLGQNTYYAVNDMMIPCPYVIYFNKEMIANMDLEDPYQLVYDGKWTLERFDTMARMAIVDIDGNGKMDEHDSWGMCANEISKYISFMTGAGQYITDRDANGKIVLAFNNEKTLSMIERFAALANDNAIYLPPSQNRSDMLTLDTGRLMFQLDTISAAELMRDYEVDFGLVPYPKYDEAQADYITLDWGGLLSVPCTITNSELVGSAMELLAWESANEVIPTYYDMVLQGKLARDDDAIKMMDLLFDTITYEIGGNYFGFETGFSDLFYALPRLAVEKKSSDFASFYDKREKSANKSIEKFYTSLENTEAANG